MKDHCGLCGNGNVKLYRNVGRDRNGNKVVWWICTSCATTRQLRRHYLKKSICELEEMRKKAEKRLSTLVSVLNQKLIEADRNEPKPDVNREATK